MANNISELGTEILKPLAATASLFIRTSILLRSSAIDSTPSTKKVELFKLASLNNSFVKGDVLT